MVKLSSAVIEDSRLVELPVGGVDVDSSWLGLKVIEKVLASAVVVSAINLVLSSLELAFLLGGEVGVGLGGGLAVGLDVSKSWVDVSSLASEVSVVGGGAIDELLLGEGGEISGLQESVSLDDGGSSEGPARSARSLVGGGVDGSNSGPVNGGVESIEINVLVDLVLRIFDVLVDSEEGFSEFLISEVHELVLSELVGAHWVVVDEFDLLEVFPENRESKVADGGVLVWLVLGFPSDVSSDDIFRDFMSSRVKHGGLEDNFLGLD